MLFSAETTIALGESCVNPREGSLAAAQGRI